MTKKRAAIVGLEALIAFVLVFAIMIMLHSVGWAQVNFTDSNGHYAGTMFQHGNERTFTNSRGEFVGSSVTHGATTTYSDGRGRFSDSSTVQGTSSHPLGHVNGSAPFGGHGGRGR